MQGKTIDIIVNGPSFAEQMDIVKGDGFDKCMVNFAANTPIFWEMKPAYYCVSDPAFFSKTTEREDVKSFFNNIKRVNWDLFFFVRYCDFINNIQNTDIERLEHVHFVPYHSTTLPFFFKFRKIAYRLFKKGQAMPNPMSVSIPVIMNAINCGYTTINLYGYDQNWIHNVRVDENNRVCLQDTHFDNVKGTVIPWKKNPNETWKMYEVLQTQVELFESYWFIKEYADYLGNVRIINRSKHSLLDAFDRQ